MIKSVFLVISSGIERTIHFEKFENCYPNLQKPVHLPPSHLVVQIVPNRFLSVFLVISSEIEWKEIFENFENFEIFTPTCPQGAPWRSYDPKCV